MHMDPVIPVVVGALFIVLLIGTILQRLKQPYVVGYLAAGIVLGPFGLGWFTDTEFISQLGAFGVILLLFFVGMEISLPRLVANWRVAVVGTLAQILLSVGLVWGFGTFLEWPLERSILLGFVISLSSTAVVLKVLQDWKEIDTPAGQDAVSVLLVQDIAIIPMLIMVNFLGGAETHLPEMVLQGIGGVLVVGLIVWLAKGKLVRLPLKGLKNDHEMQIFSAFVVCFGFALITGLLGLSAALGAFLAGLVLGAARETKWVHRSLEPFHVVFVALFFLSVGMLLDVSFFLENWVLIVGLTFAALFFNTVLNAGILKVLGRRWSTSWYAGALLAQIGEFSFVLAAVGSQVGIIAGFGFQITLAVITLTLMFSPIWMLLFKKFVKPAPLVKEAPTEPGTAS